MALFLVVEPDRSIGALGDGDATSGENLPDEFGVPHVTLDLAAEVEVFYAFNVFDLLQAGNAELDGRCAVEEGEKEVVLGVHVEHLP